ncbi:MAG: GNAT family N-acetyltransferase [Bacillota bacterium]|nr:GNAT family N-acetyltransferase [Bacillota bacterium]
MIIKDGREILIREAEITDAFKLSEYMMEIPKESDFLTFGENEIKATPEIEEKIISSMQDKNNSIMLLALIDGKIAGNCTFRAGERIRIIHTGEFGITVRKEYWGLGIGTYLLETLIYWAKETKIIRKINLRVRTDNYKAIKLYEKFGFEKEGIIRRDFLIEGKFYDSILMGLLL